MWRVPGGPAPILILSVATGYGGAERNVEILLRHLPPRLPVGIVAESPLHLERLAAIGRPRTEVVVVASEGRAPLADAVRTVRRLYRRMRPSAVLANTETAARILAQAAAGAPGLGRRAHLVVQDYLWRDLAASLDALPRAGIIVPDRSVLARPGYLTDAIAAGRGVSVLPCPVELPTADDAIPAEGALFLHLASVNAWKGHDHLIRALALHRARGGRAEVVSIGQRPDLWRVRRLEAEAEREGLGGAFTLCDHVPDPAPLLRACRAVVVTSISRFGGPETFGRAIVEAWAHARPVIAFACGAPAGLIRHEVDGLLVREGDERGLADAITRLADDGPLCARLGRAGRARAEAEFAAPALTERLLRIVGYEPPGLLKRLRRRLQM